MEKETTHAVFFDGTSYYVDDIKSHQDNDTIIVFNSDNLSRCEETSDKFNNNNK